MRSTGLFDSIVQQVAVKAKQDTAFEQVEEDEEGDYDNNELIGYEQLC